MLVKNPNTSWDRAVSEASEVYRHRMVTSLFTLYQYFILQAYIQQKYMLFFLTEFR